MSRVYFHSPSGTAEILGSERAWLGSLVSDLSIGLSYRDISDLLGVSQARVGQIMARIKARGLLQRRVRHQGAPDTTT
jgi:transposase